MIPLWKLFNEHQSGNKISTLTENRHERKRVGIAISKEKKAVRKKLTEVKKIIYL
jgi:hypothetical protein